MYTVLRVRVVIPIQTNFKAFFAADAVAVAAHCLLKQHILASRASRRTPLTLTHIPRVRTHNAIIVPHTTESSALSLVVCAWRVRALWCLRVCAYVCATELFRRHAQNVACAMRNIVHVFAGRRRRRRPPKPSEHASMCDSISDMMATARMCECGARVSIP